MEMRRMADDEQTSESDVVHSTLKKSLTAVLDQLVAIPTAALLRNDVRQSQRPGTVRTRNRSIAPRGCLPPRNQRFGLPSPSPPTEGLSRSQCWRTHLHPDQSIMASSLRLMLRPSVLPKQTPLAPFLSRRFSIGT